MTRARVTGLRVAAGVLLLASALIVVGERASAQAPDTTPPRLVSVQTNTAGTHIILTFSEDIAASPLVYLASDLFNSMPSDFLRAIMNVTIDGQRDLLIHAETSGKQLSFQITQPAITSVQQVRISHDNIFAMNYPGLIIDRAGNPLTSFGEQVVENRSTIPGGPSPRQGPVLSTDAITLTEGGTTTYTVELPSQPTGQVTVNVQAMPYVVSARPGTLTFDGDDWDEPRTVTLTAGADSDSFHSWAVVGHTYSDAHIGRSSSFARVVVDDTDPPLSVTGTSTILHAENAAGSLATYSVNSIATIRWGVYGADKDAFAIGSGGELLFMAPPDFEQPADVDGDNVYVVAVLAADGSSTGFAFVTVAVTNVAEPPKFDGTATIREVPENSPVGAAAGDPVAANDMPTYSLEGTDAGSFDIDTATGQITTRSGVTYDHETKSSYSVTVKAEDGNGATDTIAVTIKVADVNEPPIFADSTTDREVAENTAAGGNVGAPVSASDEDGDNLTYTLAGSDADSFDIVSGGQIKTRTGVTYDHETNPSYVVTVGVSDGKDASGEADRTVDDTTTAFITVTDLNEAPAIGGPLVASFDENTTGGVATYTADDVDAGDTFEWSLEGPDRSVLAVDSSGRVEFQSPPNHEARHPVYSVVVKATDAAGLFDTRALAVTVRDVNEPPVLTVVSEADPLEYAEDTLVTNPVARYRATDPDVDDTVIWELSGTGADAFSITNGVLKFLAPPDYEARSPVYRVTVRASDGTLDDSRAVTVAVTNVEEPGTLTLSSSQPRIGIELTAELEDPDGVESTTWTWERSTSRGSGGWTVISGAAGSTYTPTVDDQDHYLRVTVDYSDGHSTGKRLPVISDFTAQPVPATNRPPTFPGAVPFMEVRENAAGGTTVGSPVRADDAEGDPLIYSLHVGGAGSDPPFVIHRTTAQIRVADSAVLDHERDDSYMVTVTAADSSNGLGILLFIIRVADVNEPPVAQDDNVTVAEDEVLTIGIDDLVANDGDPDEDDSLTITRRTNSSHGHLTGDTNANTITYTPNANYHGPDSFTYTVSDGQYPATATVRVSVIPVNDEPVFPSGQIARRVPPGAVGRTDVGAPVTATDVDGDSLRYRLSHGSSAFAIDEFTAQISVTGNVPLDTQKPYTVTVTADDGNGGLARVEVTITVSEVRIRPPVVIIGDGFGGGGGGPSPSDRDFEWNVKRDIEELTGGHDGATGMWSDSVTLWLAHNGHGPNDAIYAYDLETGERVEEREFELDERNGAPRGLWSDGRTMWISDSGRNRLFAHDLASGERLPERDLDLDGRNGGARGIWSDGETMWVLDGGRRDALFAYDLESSVLLAEYALASPNGDPHGLFFDGVTFWVSDHGAKRLFAYRLKAGEDGEDELERNRGEEFPNTVLSRASNNSPRGIWSDGDVMYVADQSDDKVYTYNMPDAIDARLASLSLSGVDIGEFSPRREEYEGVVGEGVTETTVQAEAMQRRTTVVIDPPDAAEEAEGHQVALEGVEEITVTVTSADGSRKKTYRAHFPETGWDPARDPWPHCLRGAVSEGFSLVVYEGGSVEDLAGCAESQDIAAFYALHEGVYVSYLLGAPDFVNEPFHELFADGLPAITPLVASSNGPPSADRFGGDLDAAGQPWPVCLRGRVSEGFSLVVYEGGSVEGLLACAESLDVTAVYVLADSDWVSYILGASDFVNQPFRELYPDGLPPMVPLVAKSTGPPAAGAGADAAAEN